MAKEKPNKWTREVTFWEANLGDVLMWVVCVAFLLLTVGGFYVAIFHPRIPGLSELFSSPPAVSGPPPDQKLNLAPGETEMRLFPITPKKPPSQPAAPKK